MEFVKCDSDSVLRADVGKTRANVQVAGNTHELDPHDQVLQARTV